MKAFVVLLAALGVAHAGTSKWVDFRVKYSPLTTGVDVNSFFKVQNTLRQANAAGWVNVTTTNDLGVYTVCKSATDVRLCPIYDRKGNIAGMQMAVPPSDVENQGIPYDQNAHPVFLKKAINGLPYWTSAYYIVDPAIIAAGGRDQITTIGTGLWLKNGTSYTQVPTDEQTINSTATTYTWQNCIPNMGKHYYNHMTPSLRCEDFEPFFLLAQAGDVVGIGWQFLGRTTPPGIDWYDAINGQAVQTTVPLGPDCLWQGADRYGVISIHMYFVDKPWTIPCRQSTDSVRPIPGLP